MHGQPSRAARLIAPRHARHRGRDRAPHRPADSICTSMTKGNASGKPASASMPRLRRRRLWRCSGPPSPPSPARSGPRGEPASARSARSVNPRRARRPPASMGCAGGRVGGPGGRGRVGGRSGGACRSRRLGRHPPWRGPCTAEVRFAAARRQGLFQNPSRRATPGAWDGVRSALRPGPSPGPSPAPSPGPSPGPSPAPSPTPDRCSATAGPCRRCATAFAACAALMSFSIIRA